MKNTNMKNVIDYTTFVNEGLGKKIINWMNGKDMANYFISNKKQIIGKIQSSTNYSKFEIEEAFDAFKEADWKISKIDFKYNSIVHEMLKMFYVHNAQNTSTIKDSFNK